MREPAISVRSTCSAPPKPGLSVKYVTARAMG